MGPSNMSGDGEMTAVVLKKGPWTAAEDGILREYVEKYGEGNWNAVQRNSGLARCGKSCRLRWANHLRPNLKKGAFSMEEERLILELHAKIGNKWARMATQLPGRTDNEIKNYWNTRVKRRLRQGLPLYPQDIHQPSKTPFHQSYLSTPPHHTQNLLPTSPSLSLHFTPLSQSGFKRYHNTHSPNIDFSLTPPHKHPSSPLGHYLPPSHSNVGPSMWAPLPHVSAFTSFDQQQQQTTTLAAGRLSMYQGFKPSLVEFPSNQMLMQCDSNHNYDLNMRRSMSAPAKHGSGLLDDLLSESHAHSSAGEIRRNVSVGSMQEIGTFDGFMTHWDDSGSIPSSSEMKTKEEHAEQNNMMHEDLSNILNIMPVTMKVPSWFNHNQEISNGQSSSNVNDNLHVDVQQFASSLPTHNSNWDNLPEICYQ